MRRKILSILLASLLFMAAISPCAVVAQTISTKKVVSVVFDDSESMNDDTNKWVYANYAMQTFAGLLNKDDELYITYMNNDSYDQAQKIDLTVENIQSSIDHIRSHFEGGPTPKESIDTAMDKLRTVNDSNPNTKYWLVVFTDGQIFPRNNPEISYYLSESDLAKLFTSFTAEKMPNGSNPQVSYFAIGSSAVKVKEDVKNRLYTYSASSSDEIMDVMSQIADNVSGNIRIPKDKMVFVNDKTVQVTFDLPVLNTAVLLQKSLAKVHSVKGTDTGLTPEKSAELRYPNAQENLPTDESLKGGTFIYTNGGMSIHSGTYTFTFTAPVDNDSVVIMYEPAIEMRMKVYLKETNQEVTNIKDLSAGDKIDVVYKLYEIGTDKEADTSFLSADVTYSVSYYENGNLISEETDRTLTIKDLNLNNIDSELKATIQIPEFIPMTNSVSFHPAQYTMQVTVPDGDTIIRTSLSENEKRFVFTILDQGVALTKAEVENLNIHFTIEELFGNKLDLEAKLNDDGTYTCVPVSNGWSWISKKLWNWHVSYPFVGLPIGELKVTGGIGEGRAKNLATGTMKIEQEPWWSTIINIVIPIWILGLFVRIRKFPKGTTVTSIDVSRNTDGTHLVSDGNDWESKSLRSLNVRSLVPYVQIIKIENVVFYARAGGYIGVKRKKIGQESRRIRGRDIDEDRKVNYPISLLGKTFVPGGSKYEEFTENEILFNTSDTESGTLFKFMREEEDE